MCSKIQAQLVLSLMQSKTRPRAAKPLVEMCRGADHIPADFVDEANLFDGGGQTRLANVDGLFDGAQPWMNVYCLQIVSNGVVASW